MQQQLFSTNELCPSGAIFSADKKFRHCLWRTWDADKPKVLFIGLNPSTANENKPDPTVTRLIEFAKCWNYGGFLLGNLFELVSKKPQALIHENPGESDNLRLLDMACSCERVVFMWGAFKQAKKRSIQVIELFERSWCFKINADGSPTHPLYLPSETQLIIFR